MPLAPRAQVTPLNGDPDLFVTDNDACTTARPGAGGCATYESRSYGGDAVSIANPVAGKTYRISVFGFQNAMYTITASLGRPTTLLDGVPQFVHMESHQEARFVLFTDSVADPTGSITITATPLSGSVELFVSPNGTYPLVRHTRARAVVTQPPPGPGPLLDGDTARISRPRARSPSATARAGPPTRTGTRRRPSPC